MLVRLGWFLGLLLTTVLAPCFAQGQDYPSRPIKLIVGYVPGPGPDFAARTIAPKLAEILGQPVVVENKAGAGGSIAAAFVAAAPADGYTLFMAEASQLEIAPFIFRNLSYNSQRDFTPISLVTDGSGFVLASSAKGKIKTIQDVIALSKKEPDSLTYGTAGVGTLHQFIMEAFTNSAGIKMRHIPYKGGGQSMPAFLAGDHDVWTGSLQSIFPHVRAGTVTVLAVTAESRLPLIPNVPSLGEIVPGFAMESHTGIMGPAKLPAAVVNKLNSAIRAAIQDPAVRVALSADGTRAVRATTPQEYQELVRKNLRKFERIAREANINPE